MTVIWPIPYPSKNRARAIDIRRKSLSASDYGSTIKKSLIRKKISAFPSRLNKMPGGSIRSYATKEAAMPQFDRITLDPAVMGGKPCIRGQRVTVGMVLGLLAANRSPQEILNAYPYLETEDIDQCLAYAAWRMEERDLPLSAS